MHSDQARSAEPESEHGHLVNAKAHSRSGPYGQFIPTPEHPDSSLFALSDMLVCGICFISGTFLRACRFNELCEDIAELKEVSSASGA